MSAKRRLIFAISSLVVVLVITSGVLVYVLAAISQSVNTNVKVSYISRMVAGTVTANYTLDGDDSVQMTTPSGAKALTFTGSEVGAQSGTLSPESNIVLTSTQSSVVFEYSFTNTGDTNYTAMLTIGSETTTDNILVQYSRDGTSFNDYNNGLTVYNNTDSSHAENYYVKISIIDTAHNATFSGAFSWELVTSPNETIVRTGSILYGSLENALINNITEETVFTFVNDYTIQTTNTSNLIIFTADKNVTITKRDGTTITINKGEYVVSSEVLV